MKRKLALILALLCLSASVSGCARTEKDGFLLKKPAYPESVKYPDEDSAEFSAEFQRWTAACGERGELGEGLSDTVGDALSAAAREFLSGAGAENRLCSPLNIFMALSMLAEITAGNSRAEILSALGAESPEGLRKSALAAWKSNYADDGILTSLLSNSVWLSDKADFKTSALDSLAENCFASAFRGEMGSDEFNAALRGWINGQTGGLLSEQADSLGFDSGTLLALVSAIYYKATWGAPFSSDYTAAGTFYAPDGELSPEFMHQSLRTGYFRGSGFSAVAKELLGGGRMWLILPDAGVTPDELIAGEDIYSLCLSGGDSCESSLMDVSLSVPKFDLSCSMGLSEGLRALGITDVFDPELADFSAISGLDGLFLSDASHAARVKIDEKGCEAAAFTMLTTATSALLPIEKVDFILDRPFIFMISGTGELPLFAGVVNRP